MLLARSRKHQATPLARTQAPPVRYSLASGPCGWVCPLLSGTQDVQVAFLHGFIRESAHTVTDSVAARRRHRRDRAIFIPDIALYTRKGQLLPSSAHI